MVLYIVEYAYVKLCCDIKIVCEYIKTFVKEIRFWQNFKFPGLWMKVEIKIWDNSSAVPLSRCCYCCQSSDMLIPGAHNTATVSGKCWQWFSWSKCTIFCTYCTCVKIRCLINQKWYYFPRDDSRPQFLLQAAQSCNCMRWLSWPGFTAAHLPQLMPWSPVHGLLALSLGWTLPPASWHPPQHSEQCWIVAGS